MRSYPEMSLRCTFDRRHVRRVGKVSLLSHTAPARAAWIQTPHLAFDRLRLLRVILRSFATGVDHRHGEGVFDLPHHYKNQGVARPLGPNPAARSEGQLPYPERAYLLHPRVQELGDAKSSALSNSPRTKPNKEGNKRTDG